MDDGPERQNRIAEVYLAIIARYKNYIEEKERISVVEMPSLITPDNDKVKAKAVELKNAVSASYNYETDFYEASVLALEFINKQIEQVVLPVQFWITPEDVLRLCAGDIIDRCVLLCSLLISLGNPSAKVLIHITQNARDAFVYYVFDDKVELLGADGSISEFDDKQQMLAYVRASSANQEEALYEFNNIGYESLL